MSPAEARWAGDVAAGYIDPIPAHRFFPVVPRMRQGEPAIWRHLGAMTRGGILNVQVLRAVAAGIVAYYHLQPMLTAAYGVSARSHFGAFGVDIFFVISGFVMYVSNRAMDRPIAPFLVGRMLRIVPLYWVATLAVVAFYYAGFHPVGLMRFEPYMLLQSLFFVQTWFPDGRYDLILSIGWTLIYELFFYLVFALSFPLGSPGRSLLLVTLVFAVLAGLGVAFPGTPHRLAYFLSPILLEFLLGGALALWVMRLQARAVPLPGWAAPAAIAVLAMGCALVIGPELAGHTQPVTDGARAFLWGPPALMIVGGCVMLELCGWRVRGGIPLLLGAASYMLYLFHPLVLQGTVKVFAAVVPIGGTAGAVAAAIVAQGGAIAAGIVVHLAIERRLLAASATIVRRMGDFGGTRARQASREVVAEGGIE